MLPLSESISLNHPAASVLVTGPNQGETHATHVLFLLPLTKKAISLKKHAQYCSVLKLRDFARCGKRYFQISFNVGFSSVQFSCSVMSDSLRPHELQHARPPCPSPTPRVHSDSRPLSQWCHPAISSLVVPFSSCPQSLPASESFPKSQLFAWDGQSTGLGIALLIHFTRGIQAH